MLWYPSSKVEIPKNKNLSSHTTLKVEWPKKFDEVISKPNYFHNFFDTR